MRLREAAHFDAHVGGNRNNGGNAGLWYLNVNNTATNTNTNIGSRLASDNGQKRWAHGPADRAPSLGAAFLAATAKHRQARAAPQGVALAAGFPRMDMYQAIIDFDHLVASYQAARLGKRYRGEVVRFTAHLEEQLLNLHNHLVWETWETSPAREFVVLEPKMRRIQAPPFVDRIVHHALIDYVQPLFERRFIHHSYACRVGKGVHGAIQALQRMLRQARREWGSVYVVQADIRQFFASVYHEKAMQAVGEVIDCPQTLGLWRRILSGYGHDRGFGLPVGALSSQLTANVLLDGVDHQMTDDYGAGRYLRYMDDIIILQPSKADARRRLAQLNYAVTQRGLTLNPKTHVRPAAAGVDWCGYRTWSTHILPRKRNIKRARRRIAKISADYRQGVVDLQEVAAQVHSLLAYAKHCDAHRTIAGILDQMDLRRMPQETLDHDDPLDPAA